MLKTSLAFSNLRGFTIVMVVAFHSCIAYLGSQPSSALPFNAAPYGWMANPIIDSERWFGLDLFCAFQYVYLMHLMFFLSGLFVWPSLGRKGGKTFLYDRCLRLGAPFIFGVSLLMPVAYYPVYRVAADDPSWSAFWSHWTALPFWPSGPLWFLSMLLALNVAVAALYFLAPRSVEFLGRLSAQAGAHPGRYAVALIAISALAYVPLAALFQPWQWVRFGPFAFQPSFAPPYAIYFFAGLGVGAGGFARGLFEADGSLARQWFWWLAAAPAAFLMWIIPTALIVSRQGGSLLDLQIVADIGFAVSSATSCFALIAVFLRFTAVRRPILGSLSEHAYGIYLIHYVFVIWLQYALLGAALFAVIKAAIVFIGTLVLSWMTSAVTSRIPLVERLVSGKRRELVREL
jgi:glucans biosynthesis protein C